MVPDPVGQPFAERFNRSLERRILKWRDLAALLADKVVMMVLASGKRRFVASGAAADVEPRDELEFLKQLERPVDRRDSDSALAAAQLSRNLMGAEYASLSADEVEDRRSWGTCTVAGSAKLRLGEINPGLCGWGCDHGYRS